MLRCGQSAEFYPRRWASNSACGCSLSIQCRCARRSSRLAGYQRYILETLSHLRMPCV